jgi:hypothetical protein
METEIFNFTKTGSFNVRVNAFDNFELHVTSRNGVENVIVISKMQAFDLVNSIQHCLATKS